MPRFDFECLECKKTFEQLLPGGAPPPPCLHCGGREVRKIIAPPPVIFKGTGFYKTDNRKRSEETPAPGKESPAPNGAHPPGDAAKVTEKPKTP